MDTPNNNKDFDTYLLMYNEKIKSLKFSIKYTHVIFKYSIKLDIQKQ